jgi:hypothetical protein
MIEVPIDILTELGVWKWLIVFLAISLMPVVNSMIREWTRKKKERSLYELLFEIRNILKDQYTDNISMPMCEALLQPVLDNASRYLIDKGKDIVYNNNLDQREVVENNVRKIVENVWNQNTTWLSHFFYKGKRLSEVINESWKEEIIHFMICSIDNIDLVKRDRALENFETNLKTEFNNIRFNALSILQSL